MNDIDSIRVLCTNSIAVEAYRGHRGEDGPHTQRIHSGFDNPYASTHSILHWHETAHSGCITGHNRFLLFVDNACTHAVEFRSGRTDMWLGLAHVRVDILAPTWRCARGVGK